MSYAMQPKPYLFGECIVVHKTYALLTAYIEQLVQAACHEIDQKCYTIFQRLENRHDDNLWYYAHF